MSENYNPGVCDYCGYRIRPNQDEFTSTGGWNFVHERCDP